MLCLISQAPPYPFLLVLQPNLAILPQTCGLPQGLVCFIGGKSRGVLHRGVKRSKCQRVEGVKKSKRSKCYEVKSPNSRRVKESKRSSAIGNIENAQIYDLFDPFDLSDLTLEVR